MKCGFTKTQKERFTDLGVSRDMYEKIFESTDERDSFFLKTKKKYSTKNKEKIREYLEKNHKTTVQKITEDLADWLTNEQKFTMVSTPTIISTNMLDKMTITENSPLRSQVYYVGENKCLRPMLAPSLYIVMRELRRITSDPVRIFEIGSCFRKESNTSKHLNEFTMLNLVELGCTNDGEQMGRLTELSHGIMEVIGIDEFSLSKADSAVYKETLDVICGDTEIASGSYGPHILDQNWGVFDPWVGIGLGIERIAMIKRNGKTISKFGRSLNAVDGATMRI